MIVSFLSSCGNLKKATETDKFDYTVEKFADLQILRYKVHGFDELPLKQKELIYYLSQAALEGRDILFDQNGKNNLIIRRLLEAAYTNYSGDKKDTNYVNMETYLKRVWFSNGIH
ncbi:MAG: dihydrofolate reductase, partial [Bacteroidetes bacterium]|nr:dihydrofolate reductase [Bacteroidota bacterium]